MTPKQKAVAKVQVALEYGDLTRKPCEVCGSVLKVQAHHDDYDKPLEVRWLCARHHLRHHGQKPAVRKHPKRYDGYEPGKTVIYVTPQPVNLLRPKRTKWPRWFVNSLNIEDEEKKRFPIWGVRKS